MNPERMSRETLIQELYRAQSRINDLDKEIKRKDELFRKIIELHNNPSDNLIVLSWMVKVAKEGLNLPPIQEKTVLQSPEGKAIASEIKDGVWSAPETKVANNKCPRNGEPCSEECYAQHEGYCMFDEIEKE